MFGDITGLTPFGLTNGYGVDAVRPDERAERPLGQVARPAELRDALHDAKSGNERLVYARRLERHAAAFAGHERDEVVRPVHGQHAAALRVDELEAHEQLRTARRVRDRHLALRPGRARNDLGRGQLCAAGEKRNERPVVAVLLDIDPGEVLGLAYRRADEKHAFLRLYRRKVEEIDAAVRLKRHRLLLRLKTPSVNVEELDLRLAGERDSRRVDGDETARILIEYHVDGLVADLRAVEASVHVMPVVVRLPHHRRPRALAHPHEDSVAALGVYGLEHRLVVLVLHGLREARELIEVLRLRVGAADVVREAVASLRAAARVVMHPPDDVHRPEVVRAEHRAHRLDLRDVRLSALAVERLGSVGEIPLRIAHGVRAESAHRPARRVRNVVARSVQLAAKPRQIVRERLRRIALVARAVERDRRVVAVLEYLVRRVGEEHLRIRRVRSVARVREPEVVPHEYAVLVARLVEVVAVRHADPVADHR